jgi:enoyl-CoA hydratase
MQRMLAEIEDGIGWLTIDNPEKRNALSFDMGLQGAEIVADFEANSAVRAIVIRGAGEKAFVSGADISQYKERLAKKRSAAPSSGSGVAFFDTVRNCPKPTIAMIRGYCFGGGVALACACDLRLGASDAIFAITAGKLGLAYRPAFTQWVMETVGISTTKDILFSARRLDAQEALRVGLIDHLVPVPEIESFTRSYAKKIVDNAPLSIQASKTIIKEIVKGGGSWDVARCEEVMNACSTSEDAIEGNRAFLEKRPAVFRGV